MLFLLHWRLSGLHRLFWSCYSLLMQTSLNVIKYYAITCSWYHVIISIVVKSSKKTSLHFLFHNTSNMVFTWKIHQDYLPHNALTREQNIWYFLLQRNGFNACKINRILCFFLRQLHVHYVTSKHWCRGTGDCCMVCTIHTHEAKVVASTTIEPA